MTYVDLSSIMSFASDRRVKKLEKELAAIQDAYDVLTGERFSYRVHGALRQQLENAKDKEDQLSGIVVRQSKEKEELINLLSAMLNRFDNGFDSEADYAVVDHVRAVVEHDLKTRPT